MTLFRSNLVRQWSLAALVVTLTSCGCEASSIDAATNGSGSAGGVPTGGYTSGSNATGASDGTGGAAGKGGSSTSGFEPGEGGAGGDPTPTCDDDLAIDDDDPWAAARAVDLCKVASGPTDWGLVSARWILPDGSDLPPGDWFRAVYERGHGILDDFGPNVSVRGGARMLALSSGTARRPNDPGFVLPWSGYRKGYTSDSPFGFPKESPSCSSSIETRDPYDGAGLEVVLRPPEKATALSFELAFYTSEWPDFVCSPFNDFFVAELVPFPLGQADGNISFDADGSPISVNNAWMDVCGCYQNPPDPCVSTGGPNDCVLGDMALVGNGFGSDLAWTNQAATGWLMSTAAVSPLEEVTLRWTIYDSGDGDRDSTVLLDRFRWLDEDGIGVGTTPAPPR